MSLTRRRLLRSAAGTATLVAAASCGSPTAPPAGAGRPTEHGSARTTGAGPVRTHTPPRRLPPEVTHGPTTEHAVALTFHGAGPAAVAKALLAEVERVGARVTVLAVGSWLDEQPDIARRILDGGHDLGNHTQNHGPMGQMDAATAYAEISQCASRLRALTGSAGSWFRPSQLRNSTPLVRAAARRAGYPTVLSYDVDSLDYTDPGAEAVTRTVLRAVGDGSIVSMHFGHTGTVDALPAILDALRVRSLRAVTATELLR